VHLDENLIYKKNLTPIMIERNVLPNIAGAPTSKPLGAIATWMLKNVSSGVKKVSMDVNTVDTDFLDRSPKKEIREFKTIPLRSPITFACPIRTEIIQGDRKNPEPIIKKNLENSLRLIDIAARGYDKVDLVALPELFLGAPGVTLPDTTREDFLRIARTIPGEETDRLGEIAKKHNIYITGSMYTKDHEWPNHFFHTSFIIGPNGKVIHTHWKAHGRPGCFEWATTAHDIFDEFVKRYGLDAIWPVAKTDIGNIATLVCSEGHNPETWRALAFKGTEIYVWMMASRNESFKYIIQAMCAFSGCYGVLSEPTMGQASLIVDPSGRILRENDRYEYITEGLHIEDLRRIRRRVVGAVGPIPILRSSLYVHIYSNPDYERYPANLYLKYLPKNGADAERYAKECARW
jgi:predicted amidohydrolase